MLLNVVHFVTNLSLLPRATFRVLPAINLTCPFCALTSDFQLLFIHLKGQIVKTYLKFLYRYLFINPDRYIIL